MTATPEIGKTYHIAHKSSTMATVATVLDIDSGVVRVSGDAHQPTYLLTLEDYNWTQQA